MLLENDKEFNTLLEQSIIKKQEKYKNIWSAKWNVVKKMHIQIAQYLRIKGYSNIKIAHIKKEGEISHRMIPSFYNYGIAINLIIDDFTDTGSTVNIIYNELCKLTNNNVVDYLCLCSVRVEYLNFTPTHILTSYVKE